MGTKLGREKERMGGIVPSAGGCWEPSCCRPLPIAASRRNGGTLLAVGLESWDALKQPLNTSLLTWVQLCCYPPSSVQCVLLLLLVLDRYGQERLWEQHQTLCRSAGREHPGPSPCGGTPLSCWRRAGPARLAFGKLALAFFHCLLCLVCNSFWEDPSHSFPRNCRPVVS